MELAGLRYGAQLLKHVDFPVAEVLGPEATEEDIIGLLDRHKQIFIKPVFRGAIGKKGKAGLIGQATDLKTALKEKERLYFAEHRHGNRVAKANGVTFEGGVPGRARDLLLHLGFLHLPRPDDDADPYGRRRN